MEGVLNEKKDLEKGNDFNDYNIIKRLIETGQIIDIPHELFTDSRNSCNKIFSNLSKFYAHLRIHCDEKPFLCQVYGCGQGFN